MDKKTILFGTVLAVFLMMMIPNISAVNTQVKEEILDTNLKNNIQFLKPVGLFKNIYMFFLGVLSIVIGVLYYILAFFGTPGFLGATGFMTVFWGLINLFDSISGRNSPLKIIFDGISGTVGAFTFCLTAGLFYFRQGLYILANKEFPDYDNWPIMNIIMDLIIPGGIDGDN